MSRVGALDRAGGQQGLVISDENDTRRPAHGYAYEEPGDLACLEGDGRPVYDSGGLAVEQQGPVQQRSVSLPFSLSRIEHDKGN